MIKSPFKATYQDDLMREVIVVNFAGGGGSCVGIEQALGTQEFSSGTKEKRHESSIDFNSPAPL